MTTIDLICYTDPPSFAIGLTGADLDAQRRPMLTPRCITLLELDEKIDAIKARLDEIRKPWATSPKPE